MQTTATVGGHSWGIYRGSNGANQVYSFVRTSNTSSGTVAVAAIARWIRSAGWFGNVTTGNIQFGYEITSAPGGPPDGWSTWAARPARPLDPAARPL